MERWAPGQIVTRREVLGFDPVIGTGSDQAADPTSARDSSSPAWAGRAWLEIPVRVVEDTDEALVVYVESGAPFTFPEGTWPTADGRHPWHANGGWLGNGCLMVQKPGEHHAVWHFWEGPERRFSAWYINLQTAFRRSGDSLDTQDLELDLVVAPDRSWVMKDWEVLDERVAEGRYSAELVAWIRSLGTRLGRELDAGRFWWDESWKDWSPPALGQPPDDAACASCGSPSAQAWDTPDGRVRLCAPCAAMHDIGCP